jgi:catalase-peroxidase
VAWASASTFRGGDKRGGANGARLALAPQKDWEVNRNAVLALPKLVEIQKASGKASLADVIVLAGNVGVAGGQGGRRLRRGAVRAGPRRCDAGADRCRVLLGDGAAGRRFPQLQEGPDHATTAALPVDKAQLLTLTAPEMTALVGGMRVLGTNADGGRHGVFTNRVVVLSNDFFVNLLDMGTEWKAIDADAELFEGKDRKSGQVKYSATRSDLVFGSNSVLRAYAEVYASADGKERLVRDFISAWTKVITSIASSWPDALPRSYCPFQSPKVDALRASTAVLCWSTQRLRRERTAPSPSMAWWMPAWAR